MPGMDFLALIRQAGFEGAALVGETGFNSSLQTRGVLIRAVKPVDATVMPGHDKGAREVSPEGAAGTGAVVGLAGGT